MNLSKVFDPANLKGDIYGGITAAVVSLPVAIAFGIASGLGAEYGLYTAIILGFTAALLGGTPNLISAPTGPMTIVSALVIAAEIKIAGSVLEAMPYIIATFFLVGLIQMLMGVFKLGKYIHYIPYPVVSGFMSGIGGIIIILQLKNFFGVEGSYTVLETVKNVPLFINSANWHNVFLATGTILLIYIIPKITRAVPSTLLALVIMSVLNYFLKLDVKIIGDIPIGLPKIDFSLFANFDFKHFIVDEAPVAFSLAALASLDSLLTAVVADKLSKSRHDSNQELIGQGIGNMFCGLFGALPGAGTTPSTVINIKSGGRNKLSGIINALFLLFVFLVATPIAEQIPYPVLAGVLITVGITILDINVFKQFKKIPKADNFIMIIVLVLTVFWDLIPAAILGLALASIIFMKKMADIVEIESKSTKFERLVNQLIDDFEDSADFRKNVHIRNLNGPVFFGFASRFQDSIAELPKVKAVIFNLSGVPYMDQSGLYTFEEVVQSLSDRGINVCISEVNDKNLALMRGIKIIPNLIDDTHVFSSVEECIMWLHEPGHMDNVFAADDELYIPTAYTPNGDGINDEWQLRNIERYPNCVVRIFTREGKEIFYSEGYKVMWEGIYNGKNLPSDRYLYEIDLYNDGKEVIKGKVTIFR